MKTFTVASYHQWQARKQERRFIGRIFGAAVAGVIGLGVCAYLTPAPHRPSEPGPTAKPGATVLLKHSR
jgi:hypothetical protein